jgi:hypothetical protein
MSTHLRQKIRDAVVDAMRGPNKNENVYPFRRTVLPPEKLPAWCVYTISEDSEFETMGPEPRLRRDVEVAIEGAVQAPADEGQALDDVLDSMAADAETWMNADPSLGGLARYLGLVSTRLAVQETKTGDIPTGSVLLIFRVRYRTLAADPTTKI